MVGEAAKRQQAVNAARTVLSIKREMGTDYRVKIDGKAYTPQEISAMILQKLRRDAEDFLGEPVSPGGYHCPGVFYGQPAAGHARRRGALRGWKFCASSTSRRRRRLPYGLDHGQAQKILVYDLGGGHVRRVADRNRRRRDRGAGDERR